MNGLVTAAETYMATEGWYQLIKDCVNQTNRYNDPLCAVANFLNTVPANLPTCQS